MGDKERKRCPVCQRLYSKYAEFRVIRLDDGSRMKACPRCRSRPSAGGAPVPRPPEAQVLSGNKASDRRRHSRRRATLTVAISRLRDRRTHAGVVRDISQGGFRFVTSARLRLREIINVVITGTDIDTRITAVARVVRIRERENDFEIGARFTAKGKEVKLSDRREHKRVFADFQIRYRREGRKRANVGRVRDISQGGIRFVASERIPSGEVLVIMLDSRAAGVIEAEMNATLRVTGSASVLGTSDVGDRYEIRARFT